MGWGCCVQVLCGLYEEQTNNTWCQLLAEALQVGLELCLGCLHVHTQQHGRMATGDGIREVVCLIENDNIIINGNT